MKDVGLKSIFSFGINIFLQQLIFPLKEALCQKKFHIFFSRRHSEICVSLGLCHVPLMWHKTLLITSKDTWLWCWLCPIPIPSLQLKLYLAVPVCKNNKLLLKLPFALLSQYSVCSRCKVMCFVNDAVRAEASIYLLCKAAMVTPLPLWSQGVVLHGHLNYRTDGTSGFHNYLLWGLGQRGKKPCEGLN